MSRNSVLVDAPPSSVFSVLADARRYETFVVGNAAIRRFDPKWPDEGTTFQHSLGIKPFIIRDSTTSLATDHATFLVLETRMSVLGTNITYFRLVPTPEGTRIEIQEEAVRGPLAWLWNKAADTVLDWRNRELLRRLKRLAEDQFARERSTLPATDGPETGDGAGGQADPTPS